MKKYIVMILVLVSLTVFAQTGAAPLEVESTGDVVVQNGQLYSENSRAPLTTDQRASYDALPLGTILMYAGHDWENNNTLPGWVACTNANRNLAMNGIDVPNLEDRFIRGASEASVEGQTEAQRLGGDNTLTASQLPSHTHDFDVPSRTATGSTTGPNDGKHQHETYFQHHTSGGAGGPCNARFFEFFNGNGDESYYPLKQAVDTGHSHSVSVTVPDIPDQTTDPTGTNATMDNRPAYYDVIFIIKVSHGAY